MRSDEARRGQRRRTQFDKVADGAHDDEADADGLGDFDEFTLVGCTHTPIEEDLCQKACSD